MHLSTNARHLMAVRACGRGHVHHALCVEFRRVGVVGTEAFFLWIFEDINLYHGDDEKMDNFDVIYGVSKSIVGRR